MIVRALLALLPLLLTADGGGAGDEGETEEAADDGTRSDGDESREERDGGAAAEAEALRARVDQREAELESAGQELGEARAELETLRAFAASQIAGAREALPEALLAFDPGEDAGIGDRLAWLTTAQEQAGRMGSEPKPGNGTNPPPAGPAKREIPSPVPIRNMF